MKNSLGFYLLSTVLVAAAAWGQSGSSTKESPQGGAEQAAQATAANIAEGDGTASTATLLQIGDADPDGNGTISNFGFPTINGKGEVAVVVVLTGTQSPPLDTRGVYLVSTQAATNLVRGGNPVPNGNGVFEFFAYGGNGNELIAVNDSGSVAFSAFLNGTTGVDTDNSGIFGADAMDGVTEYVRLSDPAPDGNGIFWPPDSEPLLRALSSPGLDNLGQVSFHGYFDGTTGGERVDDRGIFRGDGMSVTKLLRIDQPDPFGSSTVERIDPAFGTNSIGQVAIGVDIFFDSGPPGGGVSPPPDDLARIYLANEVLLEDAFRSGGTPPDGDGTIGGGMWRTRIADNGNITFEAQVFDTANPSHQGRRLFHSDGVTFSEIVRQGALGPGEAELFRFVTFPGLDSNANDEVVFSATLERNAVPPDNRTSGIYSWDGSGITLLVHEGDPAPDGNGTFGYLAHPVFLNNGGQIAFQAEIEGTTPPPPSVNDIGIFVIDSSGTIHQAARTGQSLAGSTITGQLFLGTFDFNNNPWFDESDLQLGSVNAINDSGQLPFVAGLADSQAGLFLWQSPESLSDVFTDGFESGDTSGWSASSP